jgi:hypothetical protein
MRGALWNNHPRAYRYDLSAKATLPEAGAILRRAFAVQFGMPPDTFWTDRDFVTGRWMTDPSLAFGAWMGDRLVGSSLGTSWGSLGIFGPISTHPDTWNHGIARLLIPPVLERLNALGARHLAFPGTGIQENLADKARKLGIPVWKFGNGGA